MLILFSFSFDQILIIKKKNLTSYNTTTNYCDKKNLFFEFSYSLQPYVITSLIKILFVHINTQYCGLPNHHNLFNWLSAKKKVPSFLKYFCQIINSKKVHEKVPFLNVLTFVLCIA